jgi:hypothetical protein
VSVFQNNNTLKCVGVIRKPHALMRVRFRMSDPGKADLLSEACESGFRPALVLGQITSVKELTKKC